VADDAPEVVVDLEDLITGMTTSLARAAGRLPKEMEGIEGLKEAPFRYHIPKMTVDIAMSFTYSSGKVKGIFRRTKSTTTQEVQSSVKFDVVAVPLSIAGDTEGEAAG
jgi:hypothetical protein